jgi:hypothetical protein
MRTDKKGCLEKKSSNTQQNTDETNSSDATNDFRAEQITTSIEKEQPVGEPCASGPSKGEATGDAIFQTKTKLIGNLEQLKYYQSSKRLMIYQPGKDLQDAINSIPHGDEMKEIPDIGADFFYSIHPGINLWRQFIRIHGAKNTPINSVSQVLFIDKR